MTATAAWKDLTTLALEELEARIDPAEEARMRELYADFWAGRSREPYFRPRRQNLKPLSREFPSVHINDAQRDMDAMAYGQFRGALGMMDSPQFPAVRCNYGVGIMPSLFGTPIKIMDEQFNTLPTSLPLGAGAIRTLLDAGIPDLRTGLGAKVLDMAAYFVELLKPYPNARKHVRIFHPDLQGPMDVCELVWGSDLFCDMYDEPEMVHDFLSLICDTYSAFLRAFARIAPFDETWNFHAGWMHPGKIWLRDDSAMNLSPAMFDEFIRPYDQRLLEEWDGGAIHFCGRGDHFVPSMATMKGLHAIDMSQPHLNDMETIFRATIDKGVVLLLSHQFVKDTAAAGRDLRGRVIAAWDW